VQNLQKAQCFPSGHRDHSENVPAVKNARQNREGQPSRRPRPSLWRVARGGGKRPAACAADVVVSVGSFPAVRQRCSTKSRKKPNVFRWVTVTYRESASRRRRAGARGSAVFFALSDFGTECHSVVDLPGGGDAAATSGRDFQSRCYPREMGVAASRWATAQAYLRGINYEQQRCDPVQNP
jgi:hypothetical protein